MNSRNFETITELKEYMDETMKLPSEKVFYAYLSKIYTNLLQRESRKNKGKSKLLSSEKKSVLSITPDKADSNLSLNVFLDYMDIQEFIGERIFNIINKTKKGNKLSREDFCNGLNNLYYGNIKDLIQFTFKLSDFNDDGKIYDSDLELILKYIPCPSEFSQKNYIKQIKKIVSKFFEKLNLMNSSSEPNQLNLLTYQNYIEEYTIKSEKKDEMNSEFLSDYDYNAPFFYFISTVSYIFTNLPFNPKTVEYFQEHKKIPKLKLGFTKISGLLNLRNPNKNLLTTDRKKNIYQNMTNSKINSTFRCTATINANRFSYNPNDKMTNEILPKIGRTNLFHMKKSSSQIFLKNNNSKRSIFGMNKSKNKRNSSKNNHEFIISMKKDEQNKDIKDISAIFNHPEKSFAENQFIERYKSNKNKSTISNNNNESMSISTTKNSSILLNQSQSIKKIFFTPDLFPYFLLLIYSRKKFIEEK